jgi:hypothetical protein
MVAPTPKRVVHVLLPTGSRSEADEARRALEADDVSLVMGTASAHTPGQVLVGDVVVIGSEPATIREDATGQVRRFESMRTLRKLPTPESDEGAAFVTEDPVLAAPSAPDEPAAEAAPEPEPEEAEPEADGLEGMSRQDMIQYGAKHWPGERRWANLSSQDLVAAIRELEA